MLGNQAEQSGQPSESSHLTGEVPLPAIEVQNAGGISSRRLEELMAKRGSNGEFIPFSPEDYTRCRSLVEEHPRFTETGLSADLHDAITALPPTFLVKEGEQPPVETLEQQGEYETCFGEATIELADQLLSEVAKRNMDHEDVLIPIWRAGLVFSAAPLSVDARFLHIGASRDPETLRTDFYHVSDLPVEDPTQAKFVLADPMVGTGSTIIEVVELLKSLGDEGVKPEQMTVLSMFSTPEGNARLFARYPGIEIITACMDTHLNEKGWIIHNNEQCFLGDFGDILRECVVQPKLASELHERGSLTQRCLSALIARLTL